MTINELQALREQILADVTPLVVESVATGADGFSLLLRLIQSGNAPDDVYKKAYEIIKTIESKSEQLNSLMSLLEEVDVDIDRQTVSEPEADEIEGDNTAPETPRESQGEALQDGQ